METVLEGILNERLEEKAGDHNIAGVRRGGDGNLKFIAKAGNLDFEIGVRGVEFHGEGRKQVAAVVERVAQVGREVAHHLHCSVGVDRNFARDSIERVKQKMGIQLEAEQLEFRLLGIRLREGGVLAFLAGMTFRLNPKVAERPGEIEDEMPGGEKKQSLPMRPAHAVPIHEIHKRLNAFGLNHRAKE